MNRYPIEALGPNDDNGTMPHNVDELAAEMIGRRIVMVEENVTVPEGDGSYRTSNPGLALTLDNGKRVFLIDTDDCCAHTSLSEVIKHLDVIDHVILGVGTTNGYTRWHIYADLGDVLELEVSWSPGNPFYYGYGFAIVVTDAPFMPPTQDEVEQAIDSITKGPDG